MSPFSNRSSMSTKASTSSCSAKPGRPTPSGTKSTTGFALMIHSPLRVFLLGLESVGGVESHGRQTGGQLGGQTYHGADHQQARRAGRGGRDLRGAQRRQGSGPAPALRGGRADDHR